MVRAITAVLVVALLGCSDSTESRDAAWRLINPPREDMLEVRAEYSGCDDFKEWKLEESDTVVDVRAIVEYEVEVSCDADTVLELHTIRLDERLGMRRLTGCDPYRTDRACDEVALDPTVGAASAPPAGNGGALSDLELRLELDNTTLARGERTAGHLVVENPTTGPIVDPNCALVSIEFGLVPADQPDAPLWGAVEVECEPGGSSIAPGATLRFDTSATFAASEPGDYLAIVRHYYAGSAPLIVPVTVTTDR